MGTRHKGKSVVMVYETRTNQLPSPQDLSGHVRKQTVLTESLADILSERVSSTSRADSPSTTVIRVRPEKIAHRSFMRNLLNPINSSDMVERVDRGRKTTVQAEDLADRDTTLAHEPGVLKS
jgi:hypothetical protein